jgi:hypothetical protein
MPSTGALVAAAAAVGGLAYAVSGNGTAANSLRGKGIKEQSIAHRHKITYAYSMTQWAMLH